MSITLSYSRNNFAYSSAEDQIVAKPRVKVEDLLCAVQEFHCVIPFIRTLKICHQQYGVLRLIG